jgi:excisionase family DNA binding protein
MLTVPEAAERTRRNPETIRRWIRSGRLPARKVGTQHLIEEENLAALETSTLPLPEGWRRTATGEPMPNVVAALRSSRVSR